MKKFLVFSICVGFSMASIMASQELMAPMKERKKKSNKYADPPSFLEKHFGQKHRKARQLFRNNWAEFTDDIVAIVKKQASQEQIDDYFVKSMLLKIQKELKKKGAEDFIKELDKNKIDVSTPEGIKKVKVIVAKSILEQNKEQYTEWMEEFEEEVGQLRDEYYKNGAPWFGLKATSNYSGGWWFWGSEEGKHGMGMHDWMSTDYKDRYNDEAFRDLALRKRAYKELGGWGKFGCFCSSTLDTTVDILKMPLQLFGYRTSSKSPITNSQVESPSFEKTMGTLAKSVAAFSIMGIGAYIVANGGLQAIWQAVSVVGASAMGIIALCAGIAAAGGYGGYKLALSLGCSTGVAIVIGVVSACALFVLQMYLLKHKFPDTWKDIERGLYALRVPLTYGMAIVVPSALAYGAWYVCITYGLPMWMGITGFVMVGAPVEYYVVKMIRNFKGKHQLKMRNDKGLLEQVGDDIKYLFRGMKKPEEGSKVTKGTSGFLKVALGSACVAIIVLICARLPIWKTNKDPNEEQGGLILKPKDKFLSKEKINSIFNENYIEEEEDEFNDDIEEQQNGFNNDVEEEEEQKDEYRD